MAAGNGSSHAEHRNSTIIEEETHVSYSWGHAAENMCSAAHGMITDDGHSNGQHWIAIGVYQAAFLGETIGAAVNDVAQNE